MLALAPEVRNVIEIEGDIISNKEIDKILQSSTNTAETLDSEDHMDTEKYVGRAVKKLVGSGSNNIQISKTRPKGNISPKGTPKGKVPGSISRTPPPSPGSRSRSPGAAPSPGSNNRKPPVSPLKHKKHPDEKRNPKKRGGNHPEEQREGKQQQDECSNSSSSSKVVFESVHIRFYERVVGDNPSCSAGAPISLGWNYGQEKTVPLDAFEEKRGTSRRHDMDLVLDRRDRKVLLMQEWEVPYNEFVDSIRQVMKIKRQRRTTVNNIGSYDKVEEVLESLGRKLKRTVLLGYRNDKAYEMYYKQGAKASR
jgi:hypothetical protein